MRKMCHIHDPVEKDLGQIADFKCEETFWASEVSPEF